MKKTRGSVKISSRAADLKAKWLIESLVTDSYVGLRVGGKIMWDLGCVGASVLFFLIAIGYTTGCERLGMKEKQA
jgi:hypothetical protein